MFINFVTKKVNVQIHWNCFEKETQASQNTENLITVVSYGQP